jgi:hypothetical protein
VISLFRLDITKPIFPETIDAEIQRRQLFNGESRSRLRPTIDKLSKESGKRDISIEERKDAWIIRVVVRKSSSAEEAPHERVLSGTIVIGFGVDDRVRTVRYSEAAW